MEQVHQLPENIIDYGTYYTHCTVTSAYRGFFHYNTLHFK
jgi:hypothetical protein